MTKEMSDLYVTCWFIIGYEEVYESCVLIQKPSSKIFFFLSLEENCISDDFIYLLICF